MDYVKLNWQKIPSLKKLLDLKIPPKQLYCMGNLSEDIFKNCVAVVGSRKMTGYGQRVVEKIIPYLVSEGKTVVSGFMYGVDQYAHQTTIECGGKTVAVLGWGITTPLLGEDLKLAKKIISSGGLIISEWEDQKAAHWTFPVRNRIVAALSEEVIIIEAAQSSGSLITARIASRLKRKLWAVPGPITSKTSMGTNELIAKGLAQMWLPDIRSQMSDVRNLDLDDPILNVLENEVLTADEIARKIALPVSEVGAQLSILLLSGQVIEKDGKYFIADVN